MCEDDPARVIDDGPESILAKAAGHVARRAALAALALYLIAWWLLRPLGNHGLWAALVFGYAARALTLLRYYPALVRSVAD